MTVGFIIGKRSDWKSPAALPECFFEVANLTLQKKW